MKMLKYLFCVLVILHLCSCKKDNTLYDCYFFTGTSQSDSLLFLYQGDELLGQLPQLAGKPNCDSLSSRSIGLYKQLPAGKYTFSARNQANKTQSQSVVSFKNGRISSTSNQGSSELHVNSNCVSLKLHS